ncbi:type 2 isopentenyl-diphosphate Delta-isomerase [Rothia kristinae]|uniref:type 2 isopentenyl-diphosphate Delta-isomerase n=1 Tax=Rothia kristinae TaxID=37923 RepID=UPI0011A64B8E|nr:type 2 isopentenyl-diphosphate Delta-isomerase [Rothia kristinae]
MSGQRKDDHLHLAAGQQRQLHRTPAPTDWDDVRLLHEALAGIEAEDVDLSVTLPWAGEHGPVRWPVPFYLNGMTGGSQHTGAVNAALGEAAAATGLPIATGSMSMYLKDPSTLPSFRVLREANPEGFVMANLSAEATPDQARRVVEALGADALQIHINAVQETVMPEGARGFSAWCDGIAALADQLPVPVVVKEVGCGMTRTTLAKLARAGVQLVDVAGRGGTDFARIENDRRDGRDYAFLQGFGQSAPMVLLDALGARAGTPLPALLASGGVRHPYDVVRGLALGARAVGVAGTFLHAVLAEDPAGSAGPVAPDGAERLTALIRAWTERLRELCALLGARTPAELTRTDVLVEGRLAHAAALRGADLAALAARSETTAFEEDPA